MKHPNQMVQMDILGPFYLSYSGELAAQMTEIAAQEK